MQLNMIQIPQKSIQDLLVLILCTDKETRAHTTLEPDLVAFRVQTSIYAATSDRYLMLEIMVRRWTFSDQSCIFDFGPSTNLQFYKTRCITWMC